MLDVGDRIKTYTLKKLLGGGSFGDVWLAEKELELSDERILFALKFLPDRGGFGIDSESVRNELNTWIKAGRHSNIVQVYDGFVHGRYLVIVSEYVADGSLRAWLEDNQQKVPNLAAVVKMMRGILHGLSHLHVRKIIHRDLKPENILLDGGEPKITDFGVSRMMQSYSQSAAQHWTGPAGSPAYMPPEAFSDGQPLPQVDIWSAGVILYEMLSGCLPFNGHDMYAMFAEIANKDLQPLPRNVPIELQIVVTTALSKDTALRFQTAEIMRAALDTACAGLQGNRNDFLESINRKDRQQRETEKDAEQLHQIVSGEAETLELLPSAEDFFKRAYADHYKKDYDSAIQNYNEAIALNPQYAEAYYNRGITYHVKGDYDQAFIDYNKAIALDPLLANAYISRGNLYYKENELEQALIDYNKAIQVKPEYAAAFRRRANFYFSAYYREDPKDRDEGDYERAMRDYNKAIKLNPRYKEAYNDRGWAHYRKGNHEQAIMDYNSALELNPRFVGVYINRADAYVKKGENDKAKGDYNKAIELSPDYTDAYVSRASFYEQQGNNDQAIADYNKAIELSPDYIDAYLKRAHVHKKKGDNDEAIADYSKVIELSPRHENAYSCRGRAYEDKREYEQALIDCDKVIELNPNDDWGYYRRSQVYKMLQKNAKTWADRREFKKRSKTDYLKYQELSDKKYPSTIVPPIIGF